MGNLLLRRCAAIVAGVATLAGGMIAAGTANAADASTAFTDNDKKITLTATRDNVFNDAKKGTLTAYLLGSYKSFTPSDDGSKLAGVAVDSDANAKAAMNAALKAAGVLKKTDADLTDPITKVATLAGDVTEGEGKTNPEWASQLRQFATQFLPAYTKTNGVDLSKLTSFTNAKGNVGVSTDKQILTFQGLTPGYYVIVDNTPKGDTGAIPMILGTTAGSLNFAGTSSAAKPIPANVAYKSVDDTNPGTDTDNPGNNGGKPTKTAKPNGTSAGDTIDFTITQRIPNTTGYPAYALRILDDMNEGLTFNNDVKVFVTDGPDAADPAKDTAIVNTGNALYQVSPNLEVTASDGTKSTHTFGIDFGVLTTGDNGDAKARDIKAAMAADGKTPLYQPGKLITVTYSATINANNSKPNAGQNTADNQHSNNPNAWWSGISNPGGQVTPPTDNTWHEMTFESRTPDGQKLPDGTNGGTISFADPKDATNTPITFSKNADGVYVPDKKGTIKEIPLTDGTAKVALPDGEHHLFQKTPSSYGEASKPDFNFTLGKNEDGTTKVTFGTNNNGNITPGYGTSVYDTSKSSIFWDNITTLGNLPITGGTGAIMFAILAILVAGVSVVLARKAGKASAGLHAPTAA